MFFSYVSSAYADSKLITVEAQAEQSLGGVMASLGVMPLSRDSEKAIELQKINEISDLWTPLQNTKIKIPRKWIRLVCNAEVSESLIKVKEDLKNADGYIAYLQKNRAECWHNYGPNNVDPTQIEMLTAEYNVEKGQALVEILQAVGVTQIWYKWGGIATVLKDSGLSSADQVRVNTRLVFKNIPVTKKCNLEFSQDNATFKLKTELVENCREQAIKPVMAEAPTIKSDDSKPVARPPQKTEEIKPLQKTAEAVEPVQPKIPKTFQNEAYYYRREKGYFAQGGVTQVKQSATDGLNVANSSPQSETSGARVGAGLWKNHFSAQAMFRTGINEEANNSGRNYRPSWLNVLAGYGSEYEGLSAVQPYFMPLAGVEYYYNNAQNPGMTSLQSYFGVNVGLETRFVLGTKVELGGIFLLGFSKSVNKSFAQADLRYWLSNEDGVGLGYWNDSAKQRSGDFSEKSDAVEMYYRRLF